MAIQRLRALLERIGDQLVDHDFEVVRAAAALVVINHREGNRNLKSLMNRICERNIESQGIKRKPTEDETRSGPVPLKRSRRSRAPIRRLDPSGDGQLSAYTIKG